MREERLILRDCTSINCYWPLLCAGGEYFFCARRPRLEALLHALSHCFCAVVRSGSAAVAIVVFAAVVFVVGMAVAGAVVVALVAGGWVAAFVVGSVVTRAVASVAVAGFVVAPPALVSVVVAFVVVAGCTPCCSLQP